ncbi:Thermonuclease precursor [Pseudodesulfovibrio hydrargyri]|uniref:Thermonuclease n=1 Tax=Pseudodesulfovibrio hydrargyri TaxID=2125990 RepID=A0A1J5MT76_9BACT|nr:thermonuclease family protein [Pseudodesulfovibrio hydrargyri]OIQ49829.1 Thermonuclease precursor [Pseudodesulfovibrio hydrargyri]
MRRRNPLFLRAFFVACMLTCVCLPPAHAGADGPDARFLRALDGDSLRVDHMGEVLEIRLIGVDAPEYKQEYSRKARDFSQRFCRGETLRLEFDKERRDRYGRTLAYVYADGRMLNEALVRAGLAVPIRIKPNTRYYNRFKEAEEEARRERRGFWIKGGLDMTPGQWRRTHRRK